VSLNFYLLVRPRRIASNEIVPSTLPSVHKR
jgi:hypothetical protein